MNAVNNDLVESGSVDESRFHHDSFLHYCGIAHMQKPNRTSSHLAIEFQKHQPERRRTIGGYLFCCGGCCCCCCCVHSLGGLLGAAAASVSQKAESRSAASVYWVSLLILAAVAAGFALKAGDTFDWIAIFFVLPAIQLGASFVAFLCISAVKSGTPEQNAQLRALGKITLWSFLGTFAGVLLMILGVKIFY